MISLFLFKKQKERVVLKTLLGYASKYGATKQYTPVLADMLEGEVDVVNLKEIKQIDFSQYHKVIIFSAVYAGDVPKYVKKFGKKYHMELLQRHFGICFCCMTEIYNQIKGYALNSFSRDLVNHAACIASIGGYFQYDKMTSVERKLLKIATKNQAYKKGELIQLDGKTNFSTIEEYKIQAFANKMNSILVEQNVNG